MLFLIFNDIIKIDFIVFAGTGGNMVFEEKFYIGYSDINKDYKLSNTAVLKLFENASCMHSALAGESMRTSVCRWFLKSYHVKIFSRAEFEEKATVKTWSRNIKGASAAREFEIYRENGELSAVALSNWARINCETMRPERISAETFAAYGSEPERTNFDSPWIDKLKEPDSFEAEKEIFIDRNFIDANNHMNNVFYLDSAVLALPESVYQKGECSEFEIMYKKAVGYGERVKCLFTETDNEYIVTVKSADLSECHAVIYFYK